MAENKESFILYCDTIHTVNKLSDKQAGILFKTILEYVNDLNPEPKDHFISVIFEPIKQQLKRDLRKYELSKELKSNAGILGNLKRWHKDLYDNVINSKMNLADALIIAESRKTSQCDKSVAKIAVSVSDSVNVNDNVINNNKTDEKIFISKSCNIFSRESLIENLKNEAYLTQILENSIKVSVDEKNALIERFCTEKALELNRPYSEITKHFLNWAKKQKKVELKTGVYPFKLQ